MGDLFEDETIGAKPAPQAEPHNGNGKMSIIKREKKQPQDAKPMSVNYHKFTGKKLRVSFFFLVKDEDDNVIGRKYVGEKLTKIGKDMCVWKDRRYYIDYDYVYEGKKYHEFEVDVMNSTGALACFDNSKPVKGTVDGKVAPDKAEAFYTSLQGELFLHNNGIPKLWFLLALVGCIIGVAAAAVLAMNMNAVNAKYVADHTYLCTTNPEQVPPDNTPCPVPKVVTKK